MTTTANSELETFLQRHPDIKMLEVLMPDMNGILRGKRIPRDEARALFAGNVKCCASVPLCNSAGEIIDDIVIGTIDGDPDALIFPVINTLAPIPWLTSATAQVLVSCANLDGSPSGFDPRNILRRVLGFLHELGLKPVVATELEFYLLEQCDGPAPRIKLGAIPGTGLKQSGTQYAMPEDLWDHDEFLEDVRKACELQHVPMTTVHSEFSPGQYEINLHHVDSPLLACDHAVLLKRIVKGVARQHGMAASFMAKPFTAMAGCGLHIHTSVYDAQGDNIFVDPESHLTPAISARMRYAIGGLAETMADAMAIFVPNANSYRRLQPKNFVPLTPNWGYNHRSVALRISVAGPQDMRVEHRVAGADANPYLVMAAVMAGIHYGLTQLCDPGEMIAEGCVMEEEKITLPTRWETALELFDNSEFMRHYLGEEYFTLFAKVRRNECNEFQSQVSNLDYQWYLRAV
ncbi:MAG: glutamine synthetase family protein [Pseudomonadales bacterium]